MAAAASAASGVAFGQTHTSPSGPRAVGKAVAQERRLWQAADRLAASIACERYDEVDEQAGSVLKECRDSSAEDSASPARPLLSALACGATTHRPSL